MAWTDTPCIEWTGGRFGTGYGCTRAARPGGSRLAHRVAYEAVHGPIPDDLPLDHLCRNRPCVNVEHLEVVTVAENSRRGSRAKITQAIADEIRRRRAAGERPGLLAVEFGIHNSTVANIVARRRWA